MHVTHNPLALMIMRLFTDELRFSPVRFFHLYGAFIELHLQCVAQLLRRLE